MTKGPTILLNLSPLLIPFGVLFWGGLALALAQALGYFTPLPSTTGWAVGFGRLVSQRWFWDSFGFSGYVALTSALISTLGGGLIAYYIWKLPRSLKGLALVYKVPLILPHISVAFIVLVLWTQSGFISSLGHALGLVDRPADFPPLLYGGYGLGLIMAYAYKGTAFAILMTYALLRRLDPRLVDTARMLGANRGTILFRVVLPHLWPVLNTTFIILFLYAFGAFDIPFLLAESYPDMLSIQAFNLYFQRGLEHRPAAMAVLVIMFCLAAGFIWLYTRLMARLSPLERKL